MVRKSLSILLALSVLLGATFTVAVAQKPEPPQPLGNLNSPPAIDMANLPAAVTQATALQESLSAEQQAAVRQILDSFLPELKEITELLSAAPKLAPGAQPQPVDKGIAIRLEAMVKSVDAEMALVLDANQLELYRAAVMPSLDLAQAKPAAAASPQGTDGYTSNCWYCAYYDAYAKYYTYYGYLYAYYNYYYYGSGTYRYNAYIYSYYGYTYAAKALDYGGANYFALYYFNHNKEDYPYYAYYYGYQSYYYAYYAYLNSYYDYVYGSHNSYAYYSYVYNYYGYTGAYNGYYYGYYCYVNA